MEPKNLLALLLIWIAVSDVNAKPTIALSDAEHKKETALDKFKCCFKDLTPCVTSNSGKISSLRKCYEDLIKCAVPINVNKITWMMGLPTEYRSVIIKNHQCRINKINATKCADNNHRSMEAVVVKECALQVNTCITNNVGNCHNVWNNCLHTPTCSSNSNKMLFKDDRLTKLINEKCLPNKSGKIELKECVAHLLKNLKPLNVKKDQKSGGE